MIEIIGVRLKNAGKTYSFSPAGEQLQPGESVICKTAHGVECGKVVSGNQWVEENAVVQPLKAIIRKATSQDLAVCEQNAQLEQEAFPICEECIRKNKLDMKLVSVSTTFDRNKMLFYFTAEGRVDFRALVKDLAGIFHTRIELRQIGVRDEAKMLGGLGICGRPFCCSGFLNSFHPVSIKMAKEQNLSLNPTKISGSCGRLMCCLKYEHETYEELSRTAPRIGGQVQTPDGPGTVLDGNLLTGIYRVRLADDPDAAPRNYHRDDMAPQRRPRPRAEATKENPQQQNPPQAAEPSLRPRRQSGKPHRPSRQIRQKPDADSSKKEQ